MKNLVVCLCVLFMLVLGLQSCGGEDSPGPGLGPQSSGGANVQSFSASTGQMTSASYKMNFSFGSVTQKKNGAM